MGIRKVINADGSATYNKVEVEKRNFADYMYYGPIPYTECLKFSELTQNKDWK